MLSPGRPSITDNSASLLLDGACRPDAARPVVASPRAAAEAAPAEEEAVSTATFPTSLHAHVSTSFPAFATSQSGARSSNDMEMKPITGHRRRKSSLMNPESLLGTSPGKSMPQGSPRRHTSASQSSQPDLPEHATSVIPSPTSRKEDSASDSLSDDDLQTDEENGLSSRERVRRQKRRRRNTQLGQRIMQDPSLTAEEHKEANKDVVKRLLINGVFILLWYFFSLSISVYNKWMFDRDRLNFAFPLFTTSMHMLVQFALAALVLYLFPSLRPQRGHTSDLGRSRHETENNNFVMTKMFYLTRVGPCGAATGLDIGLGNTSLKFISLTFYTMCKSSSLAFVLLFAFAFGLEKPTWRLIAIITTMTMGVVLMVSGEIEFKLGGFLLVISAAAFSGLRWGLIQMLLLRNPATSNPFSSIYYLTPIMFLTLISIAIPVEGIGALWEGLTVLSNEWGPVMTPLFLLFPGCIAFLMTASEFALLQRTSVVTLSITGIFKEVVTISAASLVFEDKLTLVNFFGLIITMIAIVAYNFMMIKKMREESFVQVHGRHADFDSPSPASNGASDFENDSTEETAGLLQNGKGERGKSPVASRSDVPQIHVRSSSAHESPEFLSLKAERDE